MIRPADATVRVRLIAGLGNQLFQYAAALSVAQHAEERVQVINIEDAHPLLDVMLDRDLNPVPAGWSPPAFLPTIARRCVGKAQRSWRHRRDSSNQIDQDPRSAFDAVGGSIDALSAGPVTLNGYFQHPSWFGPSMHDVAARVHDYLRRQAEYDLGIESNAISFRRGDYVRFGWDLSASYYLRAIERLTNDHRRIWVVGDDQLFNVFAAQWLQAKGFDAAPAPATAGNAEVRDACLLASARSVVMSNSTFCWWAVTARELDAGPAEQHVLAPDRWLPYLSTNPLLSSAWQPLPTTFGSEPDARVLVGGR